MPWWNEMIFCTFVNLHKYSQIFLIESNSRKIIVPYKLPQKQCHFPLKPDEVELTFHFSCTLPLPLLLPGVILPPSSEARPTAGEPKRCPSLARMRVFSSIWGGLWIQSLFGMRIWYLVTSKMKPSVKSMENLSMQHFFLLPQPAPDIAALENCKV